MNVSARVAGRQRLLGREVPKALDTRIGALELSLCFYIVTLLSFKQGGFESVLCAGAFVLFAVVAFFEILGHAKVSIKYPLVYLTVLFWMFAISSYLWAESPASVLDTAGLKRALQIVVSVMLLCMVAQTRDRFSDTIQTVFIAACLISVVILLAKVPISQWGEERLGHDATGVNANSLGVIMGLACTLCIMRLMDDARYGYVVPAVLLFVVVVFTGTRQAMLIPLMFIGIRLLLNISKAKTLVQFAVLAAAVLAIYGILVSDPFLYDVVGDRLEQLVNSALGIEQATEHSIIERTQFREWAFTLFCTHPLAGIGYNGFAGWLGLIGYSTQTTSHCNYTEVLSGLGLIGFLLFYAPYAIAGKHAWTKKDVPGMKSVLSMLVAMLVTQYAGEIITNIAYQILFASLFLSAYGPFWRKKGMCADA